MEQILAYIKGHGLPTFVIASCIIVIIGILKLCKVFTKIENKNIKKLIYFILDVALSFGGAALYHVIFHVGFDGYLLFSFTQVSATLTLYQIYENIGARKLWQIILAGIASWFKKHPENKYVKTLKKLGLTEEAIQRIQAVTAGELKLIEANKNQEQPGKGA